MKIILAFLTVLFLLSPVRANEDKYKFELMNAADIVLWYKTVITQSVLEDAEYMRLLSFLVVSQDIPCFDVVISTEPGQHWSIYSPPTWYLTGENCVDKRTYTCEENNEK